MSLIFQNSGHVVRHLGVANQKMQADHRRAIAWGTPPLIEELSCVFAAVGREKQIHPAILPRLLEKGHASRCTSSAETLVKSVHTPLNFACCDLCAIYRQPIPVHTFLL